MIVSSQADRFEQDVERSLGREVAPNERLALAVSGGPDSMAMLALAAAAFPGRVIAATVDHGLRAAAADEAAMVAACCASIGLPHTILTLALSPGANVQAEAREARYAALAPWARAAGAVALLTAHHADDQAETYLMRLARASGTAGLAGIRVRRDLEGVALLRPLLGWTRAELRRIVDAEQLPHVLDPSNDDPRFDRTHARRLLADTPWLDARAIARAAAFAAESDATIREITLFLESQRRVPCAEGELCIDMAGLPREIRRRLTRSAIAELRHEGFPDGANVEALLDSLEAGHGGEQAGVMVTPRNSHWRFRKAPPRRSA